MRQTGSDELPICPQCAIRLRAAGTSRHPYLQCPGCGHVALREEPRPARRGPVAELVARVLSRQPATSDRPLVRH